MPAARPQPAPWTTLAVALVVGAFIGAATMSLLPRARIATIEVSNNVDVVTQVVTDSMVPGSGFDSELGAVTAASHRFNPDSVATNREHVGGILHCQERSYFYTHGVGEVGQAPVRYSILIPNDCVLTALWHTHGARGKHREFFSVADTMSAEAIGKPIFMANHLGELRVYRPGVRYLDLPTPKSIVRLRKGISAGELLEKRIGEDITFATR